MSIRVAYSPYESHQRRRRCYIYHAHCIFSTNKNKFAIVIHTCCLFIGVFNTGVRLTTSAIESMPYKNYIKELYATMDENQEVWGTP